uniref:Uncharacterized protein n=1 Tax=Tanacetum cinerariifolium TaxID=118510 RepID=A0A6L2LT46_TANCI|nr:hypothetical protein [Tanacetum cinerariifolium]
MENYKDPPVTLTTRTIDDSLENCVLIHFMSCRQIGSLPEHTEAVPFTYHLNGHYIKFRREEFCLITRLRFGLKNSDHYVEGINPFKRLLFGSDIDAGHITGQMLLDKINGEEFSKLQDEDVVVVCFKWAFKGARPNRKLRPDAFEAKAEWWVFSRDLFDGRIREAPPILTPANLKSRFNVPKYIDQRFDEQQQIIKELQKNNEAQDRLLNEVYNFYKVEELMYLGSRATDDYISLHNVDHTKAVRYKYVDCMRFLKSPESVYLDCFIKGFVVEVRFW